MTMEKPAKKHFCDLVYENLSEYLDEEVSRERLCVELQSHLDECPRCRAQLQLRWVDVNVLREHLETCGDCHPHSHTLQETIGMVHELAGGNSLPADCLARLKERVLRHTDPERG